MAYETGLDDNTRAAARVLANTIKGIVVGIGETAGKIFGGFAEESPSANRGASTEGFMARMLEAMGIGGSSASPEPSQAVARVREPEIAPAGPTTKDFNVSLDQLGCIAPPTFGGITSQGNGRCV